MIIVVDTAGRVLELMQLLEQLVRLPSTVYGNINILNYALTYSITTRESSVNLEISKLVSSSESKRNHLQWRNRESGLSAYSLALLNHVGYNVVDFAKNMLEWMSDTVTKQFEV